MHAVTVRDDLALACENLARVASPRVDDPTATVLQASPLASRRGRRRRRSVAAGKYAGAFFVFPPPKIIIQRYRGQI